MNSQERGANIQAPSLKPSVDLAKLVDLLAAAIASDKPASQAADPKSRSLFLFDASKNRLRICTSSVLLRLYSASDFKQAFLSKDSSGFIRDFTSPPFGLRAKLGGELLADNRLRLPGNVDKLMAAIGQALDGALPTPDALTALLLDEPAQRLQSLAKAAGAKFTDQAYQANLQPLAFDSDSSTANTAVAKVLAAVERIEAEDYFAQMSEAITTRLEQDDLDEDDIDAAIASLEAERERADSQITRFLSFFG